MARSWTQIATYGNQSIREAERRIQDALQRLNTRNIRMWKRRNETLHGTSETELTRIYTMNSAAIRYYHSRPHLLAAGDRHYCDGQPILTMLRGSTSTRHRWLVQVQQAHAAYIKDGKKQTTMTSFFRIAPNFSSSYGPKMLQTGQLRIRALGVGPHNTPVKTQRMITKFFPSACPLDNQIQAPQRLHHSPQDKNPRYWLIGAGVGYLQISHKSNLKKFTHKFIPIYDFIPF
jgi:hypothetical protein